MTLPASPTLAVLAGPDPYPALAALRARGPAAWVGELDGWLVCRRDACLAVMRDADAFTVDDPRFTTARVVGTSMLSTEGAEHRRHRTPFAAPFRLAAVRARFTAIVDAEATRLVAAMAPAGGAELRGAFAGPLATAVVAHALGLDGVDLDAVLGWYGAIVAATTELTAGGEQPAAGRAAVAELRRALAPVLDAEPSSSLLAAAAGHGSLRSDEALADAAVLLFGGIETTDGMLANLVAHLLAHPDALARVRADPGLVGAAVEESLRLEPAAAVVDRYATRDVALGGATIAAGDLVRVSLTAANRDPDAFPDPDRFALDRRGVAHVAFAAGPHVCVGMHLARLEAHTALRALLDGLPGLRPAPGADLRARGLVFRKPPALAVRWEPG